MTIIYIYSFPRSGNTLLRYMLEFLFCIKTFDGTDKNELIPRLLSRYNNTEFPDFAFKDNKGTEIKKRHFFRTNELHTDDLIIFLRRNIYELLGTLLKRKSPSLQKLFESLEAFCSPLETHDQSKILTIDYEDLVNDEIVLHKIEDISNFIERDIDVNNYTHFKHNMDKHRAYANIIYQKIYKNKICSDQTSNFFSNAKNNDIISNNLEKYSLVKKYFLY